MSQVIQSPALPRSASMNAAKCRTSCIGSLTIQLHTNRNNSKYTVWKCTTGPDFLILTPSLSQCRRHRISFMHCADSYRAQVPSVALPATMSRGSPTALVPIGHLSRLQSCKKLGIVVVQVEQILGRFRSTSRVLGTRPWYA
jgi:hypothetical protein